MKGLSFPARKSQISHKALANGAPEAVLKVIEQLPDREYSRTNEVETEFSKTK